MTFHLDRLPATEHALVDQQPLGQQPVAVYLARLAPGSRRAMRAALDTCADLLTGQPDALHCAWHLLRYQHTQSLRTTLAERYAPATANRHLAALRGVLKEAWRLGLMAADAYQAAADVQSIRGTSPPAGRALTTGERTALFSICAGDPTPAGRRDAALLAVAYGAGLRRAELVQLDIADYDSTTGAIRVRAGKGRKARIVYLGNAAAYLEDWLQIRGVAAGALFVSILKSGKLCAQRLGVDAIYRAFRKRAKQAAVSSFSPHDLRRSAISDLLDAGADVATVQKVAGHANIATTVRYDRRGEHAKKKAATLLHIPYIEQSNR